MRAKWHWSCVCVGVCAGTTGAQETITVDVRFADPVLTPGEAQVIEVWTILNPPPGGTAIWNTNGGSGQLGMVWGFAGAGFGLVNVDHGETGEFSGLGFNPVLTPWGPAHPGIPDGMGNIDGIHLYQLSVFGQFSTANPLLLWSGTWTPHDYEPREVAFTTRVGIGPDAYLAVGLGFYAFPDTWVAVTPSASFQVVPAPGGLLLGMATVALTPRRRRLGDL